MHTGEPLLPAPIFHSVKATAKRAGVLAEISSYVTKFGRVWNATRELTGRAVKKGRADGHYTAFELLQLAGAGKRWADWSKISGWLSSKVRNIAPRVIR